MIAQLFIDQGYPVTKVLPILKIPTSSYYHTPVDNPKAKGIKTSTHTLTFDGELVSNAQVLQDIEELLDHEFVDYGYLKVTHWLRQNKGYQINKKKVYSLMKNEELLQTKKSPNRSKRQWVQQLVPQPELNFEYLEIDIKYIYIPGEQRNAMVISIIDVKSRWVLGQLMGWRINKEEVVQLFDKVFSFYQYPDKIYIRSDNGSQFISQLIQLYFEKIKVTQEFTKPSTPEQNAHIESYHSILESVICQRFDFDDLAEAQNTFNRFIEFYNFERIHSGIKYTSPFRFLKNSGITIKQNNDLVNTFDCRKNSCRKLRDIKEQYEIDKSC